MTDQPLIDLIELTPAERTLLMEWWPNGYYANEEKLRSDPGVTTFRAEIGNKLGDLGAAVRWVCDYHQSWMAFGEVRAVQNELKWRARGAKPRAVPRLM